MKEFFYSLLYILPKNYLSFFAGLFAGIPIPTFLREKAFTTFAKRYDLNLDEVELPLKSYSSLSSFFVRDLKAGVRKVQGEIVSPVDGRLRSFRKITSLF